MPQPTSMSPSELYLRDVLADLLTRARQAKAGYAEVRTHGVSDHAQFEAGRSAAYYEVVAHLIRQLDAFGIDRASIGVAPDLDVERDLLP